MRNLNSNSLRVEFGQIVWQYFASLYYFMTLILFLPITEVSFFSFNAKPMPKFKIKTVNEN